MGFPGILQKLFSGGGKGGKLRPEIVPDIEPRGVVKMWYGEASAVPEGWAICDGTQGTPDLRDSFIIGAGGKYALDARGGAASATPDVSTGTAKTGISLADAAPGGTAGSSGTGIGIQNAALNIWTGAAGTGIGIQGMTLDGNTLPSHGHGNGASLHSEHQMYVLRASGKIRPDGTSSDGAYYGVTDSVGSSWGHAHGVSDPGHAHTVGSSEHAHGVSDPGHAHAVATEAHNHALTDGGHSHTVTAKAIGTVPPYYALCFIQKL